MRLDPKTKLFFCLKIDSKMREALAQATPGDRRYFDDPSSPYLRVISMAEDQWIGKIIEGGVTQGEIDDILRNLISILNRVAPGVRHSSSNVRIYSIDEAAGDLIPPRSSEPPRNPHDFE